MKRFIDQNKILPSRFINIRLAGDSTVLNKPTVKILNFTFSIINDKKYYLYKYIIYNDDL